MIYEFYTLDHLTNAQSHRSSGNKEYTADSDTPFPQGYRDRAYLWRAPLLQTCRIVAHKLRHMLRAEALLTIYGNSW
ncbi:hypothetical protein MN608_10874 [Microdochium nivale]|nr:hypothetical protein MN608_10874 [Microdochium nivale]